MDTKMADITLIEEYRTAEFADPEALRRARMLPSAVQTYDTVFDVLCTAPNEEVLNKIGTHLGFQLGYQDQLDAFQIGADLLTLLCHTTGLFNLIRNHKTGKISIRPGKDCKYTGIPKGLTTPSFHPHTWVRNSDKDRGSILLGGPLCHHDEELPLDSFNKLNKVGFRLDNEVLDTESDPYMDRYPQLRTAIREIFAKYRGKKFYFDWKGDTRIRQYIDGWLLNLQGCDRRKAELNFSKGQVVQDANWLKIAAADAAGKDKLIYSKRIEWFDRHYPSFDTEVERIEKEESPVLFRKFVRAYTQWLKDPTKESPVPMPKDATSSGFQVSAAMVCCRETAIRCNLIDTGDCVDAYALCIEEMNKELPDTEKVTNRSNFKKAMVAHLYNSKKEPRMRLSKTQLVCFYKVVSKLFPGAEQIREAVNTYWDPKALYHQWTLPDGAVVKVPVRVYVDYTISLDNLDDQIVKYRCRQNLPSKRYTSLAPNIIHSVDAYIAREMVRRAEFDLVHIHDCFWALPDNMPAVCQLYREILAEIAQSDLLSDILSELAGTRKTVGKGDPDLYLDILASTYALS